MLNIKARGKRRNGSGEWVYGYYVYNPKDDDHFIFSPNIKKGGWDSWNVVRKTVGRFTGLDDKDNREIYEGDVIKPDPDHRHFGNLPIVFRSGQFLPDGSQWSLGGFVSNFNCEVIGNVHDNPELLEK